MNNWLPLVFFLFLLSGCSGLIQNLSQTGNITVKQDGIYQFEYSTDEWREASPLELLFAMVASGNYDIEHEFVAKDSDVTILMVQSSDGRYACGNMNAESMDYEKMETRYEYIENKKWCIGEGYEKTPDDYALAGTIQCPEKYVVFFMGSTDKDTSATYNKFYNILETFKCQ